MMMDRAVNFCSSSKLSFIRPALVLALIFVLGTLLYAQAPPPAPAASSDALMDVLQVLQTKGVISQAEYDSLKQRVTASAQPVAPPAAAPATEKAGYVRKAPSGVGFVVGDVTVTFSGEVNAFYVHDRPTKSSGPILGLTSVGAVPNSSVRSGLLPSDFNINVATKQKGWDIGVMFGFYPGINSHQTGNLVGQLGGPGTDFGGANLAPGNPVGFGVTGIDMRQNFLTIGRKEFGTFKAGRDIGFFGQEAILNDMTLLGAGTPNQNVAPGTVTLGRIGTGYIYTDFQPQLSYMSPSFGGLQLGFAVLQPLNDVIPTTLGLPLSAKLTGHGQPQFQAKLTYGSNIRKKTSLKVWTNMITQNLQANVGEALPTLPVGEGIRSWGVDGGAKVGFHGFELLGYGYKGWGIGTEGLFFLSTSPTGAQRESDGFYGQATYTFAKKFMLGGSYGFSHLDLAETGDTGLGALIRENRSWVGQARYNATSWVTLVGEYTHTRATSHAGAKVSSDSVAVGPILFF